jgi:3D (Asp-Asp-Asp) domain-containing protein
MRRSKTAGTTAATLVLLLVLEIICSIHSHVVVASVRDSIGVAPSAAKSANSEKPSLPGKPPLLPYIASVADPFAPLPAPGKKLGRFRFTFYWVVSQEEDPAEPAVRVLRDAQCQRIARVGKRFAGRLELEGTGVLNDGRILNADGHCRCGGPCYKVAAPDVRWGLGILNRPLSPFRSVAVDRRLVEVGHWLYVPELVGKMMPGAAPWGGFVHDGCVLTDDIGGGIRGRHVDFFAGRRSFYQSLSAQQILKRVTVHDGSAHCAAAQAARLLRSAIDLSAESLVTATLIAKH